MSEDPYEDLFLKMIKIENKSKKKSKSNPYQLSLEKVKIQNNKIIRNHKRLYDEISDDFDDNNNNNNSISRKMQKLNINDSPQRNYEDKEEVIKIFESITEKLSEKQMNYNLWKKDLNDNKSLSIVYESQIIKANTFLNDLDEYENYLKIKPKKKLWKHQKKGIEFMINRELDKDNINCFGGMQCDEPGMGKTLQMLELIRLRNIMFLRESKNRFNGPTIIIATSLIINYWIDYIKNNYPLNTFIILILYPENKIKVNNYLFYDIIFTTYHIISSAFKYDDNNNNDDDDSIITTTTTTTCQQFKWLFNINFLRILCDEAHDFIINKKTLFFKSIQKIKAKYRWYITGTPIRNSFIDTGSVFDFIGLNINDNENIQSFEILKKYLDKVMLRRFKNDKDVTLDFYGKCNISVIIIDFLNNNEREVYENYNKFLKPFKGKIQLNKDEEKINHIFSIITKLRQCCTNTLIIDDIQLPNNILRINFLTDNEPYIKKINYGELIPQKIISLQKDQEKIKCYQDCFNYVKEFKKFNPNNKLNNKLKSKLLPKFSTKGLEIIKYIKSTENNDKIIIYYESIKALNQLSYELKYSKISFLLLSGENKENYERNDILKKFENEDIKVLLITKICNQGISLVCANHVIIVGPSWCPWAEIQAMHRCYRPGQKKDVNVVYFIIKNTIEEYIMELSFNKLKLSNMLLESKEEKLSIIQLTFEEFIKQPQHLSKEELKKNLIDLFIH